VRSEKKKGLRAEEKIKKKIRHREGRVELILNS